MDAEPPEPFLTVPELAVICGLVLIVAFCTAGWWAERTTREMTEWFDDTLGGW
jgi:hypothetical protein